jgi:NADH-quinone oxidoreductase subunit G
MKAIKLWNFEDRKINNPYVQKVYRNYLNKPRSCEVHEYLHTGHKYRNRFNETFEIYNPAKKQY